MNAYIVKAFRTAGGKNKGAYLHNILSIYLLVSSMHWLSKLILIQLLVNTFTFVKMMFAFHMISSYSWWRHLGVCKSDWRARVNVARNAVLASILPVSVPGTSVDRQCGSSQQAMHFAAQVRVSVWCSQVIAGLWDMFVVWICDAVIWCYAYVRGILQAVMSGTMDIVIAGGVEGMTRTPMFSPYTLAAKAGIGTYDKSTGTVMWCDVIWCCCYDM